MVLTCAYPGCLNLFKNIRLRARSQGRRLTFHRFPTFDPDRLKLWLLALRLDVSTPMRLLKVWRICSEHFCPEDFRDTAGSKVLLKTSAVPALFPQPSEDGQNDPSQPIQDPKEEDTDEETKFLGAEIALEDVPQSKAEEQQRNTGVETTLEQHDKCHEKLILLLTNPRSFEKRPRPSTSGTYYALPPIHSYHSDEPVQCKEESDGNLDLEVSMLSLDPPSQRKDVSFLPPGSTCALSTTTTTEEELPWKERKWVLNESNLMNLFRRCQECGALITEAKKETLGSQISVRWECKKRHKGLWKSCSDLRGTTFLCQQVLCLLDKPMQPSLMVLPR